MITELGIEQARKSLGDVADEAAAGHITYLTRRGVRVAAVVPLDHADETGEARWDEATGTLTITPGSKPSVTVHVDRGSSYVVHALAENGWNIPDGITASTLIKTGTAPIIHHPEAEAVREQLDAWVAEYGRFQLAVRGLPGGRIRFLIITDPATQVLEGDALALDVSDPNGQLYQRASSASREAYRLASVQDRPVKITFAEVINGVTVESQALHSVPGPNA